MSSPIHINKAVHFEYRDYRREAEGVGLYAKVDLDALDGSIRRVAFEGTETVEAHGSGRQGHQPFGRDLQPFAGADDYFELRLGVVGADRNTAAGRQTATYRGQLFVETDKGTRYAVKPSEGDELVIDERMIDGLHTTHNPGAAASWSPIFPDVGAIPVTADFASPSSERYLNPNGDR